LAGIDSVFTLFYENIVPSVEVECIPIYTCDCKKGPLDISSHAESAELLGNTSALLLVIASKGFRMFPEISALSEVLFTQSHESPLFKQG